MFIDGGQERKDVGLSMPIDRSTGPARAGVLAASSTLGQHARRRRPQHRQHKIGSIHHPVIPQGLPQILSLEVVIILRAGLRALDDPPPVSDCF